MTKKSRTPPPPKWSDEETLALKDRISALIAGGETDATISAIEGLPSTETIRTWKIEDEVFFGTTRAREARADFRADRIDGYVTKLIAGDIDPNTARVAIDAEKWQAGKEKPKVYGDRLQLDADMTVSMTDDQLDRRIAQLFGTKGAVAASGGAGAEEEAP